jgi:hypothetical protein
VTTPYTLTLFALDGSILSKTSHPTKGDLQVEVLLCQARIDQRRAADDGKIPGRFDVAGVDYDEWRAWIR